MSTSRLPTKDLEGTPTITGTLKTDALSLLFVPIGWDMTPVGLPFPSIFRLADLMVLLPERIRDKRRRQRCVMTCQATKGG